MSRIDAAAVERSALAIMLLYPELMAEGTRLEVDDFADARHAEIFATAKRLHAAGGGDLGADVLLLELERSGDLAKVGADYLADLLTAPADPRTLERLIATIKEEHRRRQAAGYLESSFKAVNDRSVPLEEAFTELRRNIGLVEEQLSSEELPLVEGSARELLAELDTGIEPGTPTGLPSLNDAIQGGIKPTQLLVLAGATGSGKTSLATIIALRAAEWAARKPTQRGDVLVFSYEMSAKELMVRLVSQATDLHHQYKAPRGFDERDRPAVERSAQAIAKLPIRIEDRCAPNVDAISGMVERHLARHGTPSLIVVDHIGLLNAPQVKGNRTEQVGAITRGLKQMAMRLRVPVLALAQLSRDVEKRDDHRPMLSDLRESGTIEQDSNIVLFVYRESYYLKDDEMKRRLEESGADAQVMVAKNRAGPTANVNMKWFGPRYLFLPRDEDMARLGLPVDDLGLIERPRALDAGSDAPSGSVDAIDSLAAAISLADETEELPFELPAEDDPFTDEADRLFN